MTKIVLLSSFATLMLLTNSCSTTKKTTDHYDGPREIAEMELRRMKSPLSGKIERQEIYSAREKTQDLKSISAKTMAGSWTERGPNSDVVGGSNGNTRYNNDKTSGRIRAILVDANDATGNTVWVGAANGGLWKTTNVSLASPVWNPINDFFSSMAISTIAQDPTTPNTMYFGTGEPTFNSDAASGSGVFKSTDGGVNWTRLNSTSTYTSISKIVVDNSGNVYLGTIGFGLLRSSDGGNSWTAITPTGTSARITDLELSSNGRLHMTSGYYNSAVYSYRYTSSPSTVTSASGWTASTTTTFPAAGTIRTEIACNGNILYALPVDGNAEVPTIFKSTDGGVTWAATTTSPVFTSGQGWYCLGIDINPSNTNEVYVGSLDCYKTTNGGSTWAQISQWVGTSGTPNEYVHADQHVIKCLTGNRVLIGSDGGLHYSSDAGATIRDRNTGLRIKQFYSVAISPTLGSNYMLAGAQDNGTHALNGAGLTSSTEVTGGDGASVSIDQDNANNQFGAYVYNTYRRSTNGGTTWGSINFYKGTSAAPVDFGDFINPNVYDNTNNIIYATADANEFFRWTTATTTAAGNYFASPGFPLGASIQSLPSLGGLASALTMSPYTTNKLYIGSSASRVIAVTNANAAFASSDISSSSFPAASNISCVAVGSTDNNLLATFSNSGAINQVWISTTGGGGAGWTAIDGNLPDMPVHWAMFYPGSDTKVILATEAGIYITENVNGASTSWYPSATFPNTRATMIKYRANDQLVVVSTHGRGIWSQSLSTILPVNNFVLSAKNTKESTATLNWKYDFATAQTKFEIEQSFEGANFKKIGDLSYNTTTNYSFDYNQVLTKAFYRIKSIESGLVVKYSNIIKLDLSRKNNGVEITALYPNPVVANISAQYNSSEAGNGVFEIINTVGQVVSSQNIPVREKGSYFININAASLVKGNYTLVLKINNYKAVQQFIKE